jgi:hypothetical protein
MNAYDFSDVFHSDDVSGLTDNQHKALAALLTNATVEEAAKECGLTSRTLRGYFQDPVFKAALKRRRLLILQQAIAGMVSRFETALAVFDDALDEANDINTRLRAATRVFENVFKGLDLERRIVDLEDHEARIAALEAEQEVNNTNGHRGGGHH